MLDARQLHIRHIVLLIHSKRSVRHTPDPSSSEHKVVFLPLGSRFKGLLHDLQVLLVFPLSLALHLPHLAVALEQPEPIVHGCYGSKLIRWVKDPLQSQCPSLAIQLALLPKAGHPCTNFCRSPPWSGLPQHSFPQSLGMLELQVGQHCLQTLLLNAPQSLTVINHLRGLHGIWFTEDRCGDLWCSAIGPLTW